MFIEVSYNKFDRGHLIVPSDLPEKIKIAQKAQQELYQTVFMFDDDAEQYAIDNPKEKGNPSISGYRGHHFLDTLLFDFDAVKKGLGYDGEATYERTKNLLNKLNTLGIKPYVIYFSGTGFHIEVFPFFKWNPSSRLPDMVASLVKRILPELDEIYYTTSLVRVVNTINKKTMLYKIPLTVEEFHAMNYSQIKELAREPREDFGYPEPFDQPAIYTLEKKTSTFETEKKEYFREPSDVVTCVQHMFNKGPQEGGRHKTLMRIIAAWRRQGIPHEAAEAIALSWSTLKESETRKIVHDCYQKTYKWSCDDEVMKAHCDSRCIFFKNKNYVIEVISASTAEQAYVNHVRTSKEGKRIDIGLLYGNKSYTIDSGSVCAIMGDTGLGKSALAMDIALRAEVKSLYMGIENGIKLTYRRFIQTKYGMTKEEVDTHYLENSNSLSKGIDYIDIVEVPPTIEEIKKMIRQHQPKMVFIDTLNAVRVPGVTDDNQKSAILAPELKALANALDVIIIPIVHINRAASYDDRGKEKSLTVHSIKGSSNQEQQFDMVLGWEGKRYDNIRKLSTLKARDESPIQMYFSLDYTTFRLQLKGYNDGRDKPNIKQSFGGRRDAEAETNDATG
jgi:archaellum biogenesis ATPase FlaH